MQQLISRLSHRLKSGFSVMELLIVVSIIVIIAALSFPAFNWALARSKQSACMDNLRQIGSAWMMYAAEHDGTLGDFSQSGTRYWGGRYSYWGGPQTANRALYPYLSNPIVFSCPADIPNSGGNRDTSRNLYRICGNSYMVADSSQRGVIAQSSESSGRTIPGKLCTIESPSVTILAFDATVTNKFYNQTNYWHPHNTSNVLMVDGHVEVFSQYTVETYQNPTNPPGYTWGWSAWGTHSQW